MTEDKSVEEITQELDQAQVEDMQMSLKEQELNRQIAQLREQLYTTQQLKLGVRSKIKHLSQERESAERRSILVAEKEKANAELNEFRRRALLKVSAAPWRSRAKDFQLEGAVHLGVAKRGLLADKRGMGKSLTAIIWRRVVNSSKTLILTRKAYADEFIKELGTWEPGLTVIPLVGADASMRRSMTAALKKHDELVVVANFELWRRSTDEAVADLINMGFDAVIIDEAHRLKTFKSVTTQGFLEIAKSTDNLLAMTGTPIENRPQELFAILHSLYPNIFPDERRFRYDYCQQMRDEQGRAVPNRWEWKPGGLEALTKKMSSFFISRSPADVGHEVPPPDIKHYTLDFEGYADQREAYKFMAERTMAKLTSGKVLEIPSQITLMLRLAQLVSWPAGMILKDYDEDGRILNSWQFDVYESVKTDWAEDLMKELVEEGERVVFFSRFVPVIHELQRRLKDTMSVSVITGEVSSAERRGIANDFDLKTAPENPKYNVLLATYDSVGESLNLNGARHAILYEQYWKPSKEEQAIGRIDRLNSVDQATVHMPKVDRTIDIFMEKLVAEKRDIISAFKSAQEMQEAFIENLQEIL